MLRPGGHLRPDSALRSLRDNGLAAEPITVVPRSSRGAHGRVVWYSSLMLDVARLVRIGNDDAARDAHVAATKLASHRSARFVADCLAAGTPDPDPAAVDAETGGALSRLATLTESARGRVAGLGVETFAGRVADVSGRVAFVVDDEGRTLPIPTPASTPSPWAGSLVSVDTELFDGGATTIWIRPAFDPDADPNERVAGGPHVLTPAERERLATPALSAR